MSKIQQAAKEHLLNRAEYHDFNTIANISTDAFLAGAEYAAGSFAEWAANNDWSYHNMTGWSHPKSLKFKTTTELYTLWQQSL